MHHPPRIRLAAIPPRNGGVDSAPLVEAGQGRVPHEARVVALPRGDDPVVFAHTLHLPQHADGVGDVLEDLVAEDDVEFAIGVG